jgi:hypothetical protein
VSDGTSKKHFSYWTPLRNQTKLKNSQNLEGIGESFRILNAQGKRGGDTPGWPFYREARGRPAGAKILNFDAPAISKSHGEDQKEM